MTEEKKELSVKSVIGELLTQDSKLSVARQIELAFDEVVKAQDMGFTDAQIVEALGENGIEVKLMNFRMIMSRIRRARGKAKKPAKKTVASAQPSPAPAVGATSPAVAAPIRLAVAGKTFERSEVPPEDELF